jgi:hypothetical protein
LVGVWDVEVDYFYLDGKKIQSPKQVAIECDPFEASKSNPNAVMDFARRAGAIYNDPNKGEVFIIVTNEAEPHAYNFSEIMNLFG